MKVYTVEVEQILPIDVTEAWKYFATPLNLKYIAPDYMQFTITSQLKDGHIYAGQIIEYSVKPIAGIPLKWVTEITRVEYESVFIDEQKQGPFSLWHHEHWFSPHDDGVLMKDVLHYAMPLGWIGTIVHRLYIHNKIREIFAYRKNKLTEIFPNTK